MPKSNENKSFEITTWVAIIAIIMIFLAVFIHKTEFGSDDIARPEISGHSQENAVGSMLKANHPDVSDDKIKSGAKKIVNEWNEATKK